ncbi:S1 family peptidase [Shewanella halotolerans]|uniref:S1 family peptidase n=1 Tax=Shewanella halotolerans TaxID=2864204 RepID=UPI001C65DFDD|nr:serine protease [Shewanella halotolerans]QYJ91557.1 serine protease [Shewanella halotolerans]
MNSSVLKITNRRGSALGTGFVIKVDDNGVYVATCGHVVASCGEEILVDERNADIICNKYSEGLDLAVLYVKGLKLQPFELALVGDTKVKVIGYSKIVGTSKKEMISNIPVKHDVEINSVKSIKLYPNEDICEGYSGSPVLCEVTNNVVGVVNIKSGQDNYAISSEHLSELIDVSINVACQNNKIKLKTHLNEVNKGIVRSKLQEKFDRAMASFSTQKNTWVTPNIDRNSEEQPGDSDKVDVKSLIENPTSTIIKSRQQYGATSLAHYLVKEAWCAEQPSFWLYLDASHLKPHKKEIDKEVNKALESYGLSNEDIECVILDEFSSSLNNGSKILSLVNDKFKEKPIILMYSMDTNPLIEENVQLPRKFIPLYLWSLDRKGVRNLVANYNSEGAIGDDSRVLNKVVDDLEALNIPRTPQNCLTILKISERDFDDSPVNRAEMIGRVLHLLFNVDDIPHYKTRPDLKDTEFTLGYFCEQIIRSKKIYFTRNQFIEKLSGFCRKKELDLEVSIIFDILYTNNIIVLRNEGFCFKFTYWIYYFAAHRMLHDNDFSTYILENLNYVNYPEVIEFYTGIDRRRDSALSIIANDLNKIERTVNRKCKLPEGFDIYQFAKWLPSEIQLERIEKEISEGVSASSLPDEVKDEYADRGYNRATPLNQNLNCILEEYSVSRLIQCIKAASLALRNSDFADTNIKHNLLNSVLQGIKQLTNVLVALSPVLASNNSAKVEGVHFHLYGSFSEKLDVKLNQIIGCLPSNMVDWYVDKLFTKKMGTLLNNRMTQESDNFKIHFMNLMLIAKRPKNWEEIVAEYILSVDKNSFYLLDVINALEAEYRYSYTSQSNINKLGSLIKLCAGKHRHMLKKPSVQKAKNLPDTLLPERHI